MKLPPLPSASSSHILLLSVFSSTILHCFCQQQYLNNSVYECSFNLTTKAGYICNGLKKACPSFVTFKSIPPYDTPLRISNLFSSEASSIASINNISTNNDNISPNRTVIVPTYCSCSGNIYQHATSYEMEKGDYYFKLANNTYQGLVNCQMLVLQNYYLPENISIGAQVSVPILCACPTATEISDGVASLLVHTFDYGDSLGLVAESYGVDQQSLISANELPSLNATISASTPILVPLKPSSCRLNPHMFYCTCSFSQLYYSNSSFSNLNCGHLQSDTHGFPIKLVASIGKSLSIHSHI